jgi:hypothetical protein
MFPSIQLAGPTQPGPDFIEPAKPTIDEVGQVKGQLELMHSASNQSGVTTAWAGLTSNVPFLLTFRVVGTGTMTPAFGKSDQLMINYH